MTLTSPSSAPASLPPGVGTILLVEDDERLARAMVRTITARGYQVVHAKNGGDALGNVSTRTFDAVLSDLNLPDTSGVDVLKMARAHDPDVPLVLMSGAPTVDTAIEAVNLGVLEYLVKPTSSDHLARVLGRATTTGRLAAGHRREARARARREAPRMIPGAALAPIDEASLMLSPRLDAAFARALSTLSVELEPIVEASSQRIIGHVPRVWSAEPTLAAEALLERAAERLGCLHLLRRRVHKVALELFVTTPGVGSLYLDAHPSDLVDGRPSSLDPDLLARVAGRVVLQITASALPAVTVRSVVGSSAPAYRVGKPTLVRLSSEFAELDTKD